MHAHYSNIGSRNGMEQMLAEIEEREHVSTKEGQNVSMEENESVATEEMEDIPEEREGLVNEAKGVSEERDDVFVESPDEPDKLVCVN